MCVPVASAMDFGEILEKKSRAMKQRQQRSVMIGGKRVETGLDIGEILLEKDGHIRVEASAVWHRQLGMAARSSFVGVSSLCCLDSLRTARLCPTYHTMRGNWLTP